MKQLLFAVIALWQFYAAAFAANYYASPDGTGNGSSLSAPCSLAEGITKLANGSNDTLFVRGGIYYMSDKLSVNKSGTAGRRLAIWAYAGEKPVLDFSAQPYGDRGVSLQATSTYLHIKGLTIRYAGDNGLYSDGSYHIVENCEFYGNCDSGCQFKTGSGNLILNCDSYNNFDYQTGGTGGADFGGNADGFADKQYTNTGEPNIYDGCRAWGNSDDGWDFFQKAGSTIIRNSFCYKNGPVIYDMTNHPRYNTDKAWFDRFPMIVTDAYGGTAIITLAAYKNYGNGNGFKLGGELTGHNVIAEHCLSASNAVRGFDQNNNAGEMTLLNCSGFGNAPNYGFNNNRGGKLTVTNCVSLHSIGSDNFRTQTIVSTANNAWNTSGVTCNVDDFASIDAAQMIMPRNAGGSLPGIMFMRLLEGSDLIDRGVNVGLPFGGTAPDLGCFEFDGELFYPPTVTAPANRNQSVNQNMEMTDVVFTWGGSATGLMVSALPDGVEYEINVAAKTLTIKGTPGVTGIFDYTVTTLQEADNPASPASVSGTVMVKSANAGQIAFVTTPDSFEDALILEKLNANPAFNITVIDAAATEVNYSGYDMIVLSAKPNSNSVGLPVLEAVDKPKLVLKPFQLQASRWAWSNTGAVNPDPGQTTMTISDKSHEIFQGLDFTGANHDELVLFSSVTTNAVTGIVAGSWYGTATLLGVARGSTAQSLIEVPAGTDMNGTVVNSRFLMIGLSEYSTANLTPTATQLIENACYYLMGMDIHSSVDTVATDQLVIRQENGQISVDGVEVASLTLFNIAGRQMVSGNAAVLSLPNISMGVYILSVRTKNGTIMNAKVLM